MAQAKQHDDSESDSDEEAVVLMTTTCNFTSNGDSETWYLDTSFSNHMTCNLSWLVSLDDSNKCTIKFAGQNTIRSVGIGNVAFRRSNESLVVIEEVMYVPDMGCKLMSYGQLLEKEFSASLKNKFLDLLDLSDVRVFKVPLSRNRTFQVNMNNADVQCLASTVNEDESWLWHSRLGHLNFKGLNKLQ